jgi:hypothetical protein
MKTLITIKNFTPLTLALFISVAAISNPKISGTGDIVKSGVKKQISATGVPGSNNEVNSEIYYNYLRFDVNKFTDETAIVELPAETNFYYLRFDVNKYIETSTSESTEMPVNDFEYLRFDVMDFAGSYVIDIDELPAK